MSEYTAQVENIFSSRGMGVDKVSVTLYRQGKYAGVATLIFPTGENTWTPADRLIIQVETEPPGGN